MHRDVSPQNIIVGVDGIPAELDAVVVRALAYDANDRLWSALEMAEAVARCVALPRQTDIASWLRAFVPLSQLAH